MATYQETVLADAPLAYYRCDEIGTPVNGAVITDLSGNGHHAALCFASGDGTLNPYGHATAIETDAGSRSFRTFSDNLSHTGSNNRSYVYNTDAELNLSGDFTVECWVKSIENLPTGGTFPFFGKRGRFRLSRTFNSDTVNWQFRLSVVLSDNNTYTVTADLPMANGVFFHVVGGRVADALFLYVNTQLAGTLVIPGLPQASPSTSPLSLTPCQPQGDALVIGGLPFNDIHNNCDLDECAVYDFALPSTRILAHYEAALNAILLHGVANAQTTAILRSVEDPDPVEFPFRHNWTETLIERLSFRSAISQSVNGVEEGTSERLTPRRELEFVQLLRTNAERRRFRALLWANQHAKWFVPVRQDMARLLVPLSTGATTAAITTQFRDYEVGGWIGFRQLDGNTGEVQHAEVRAISSLSPLTFEALTNDYAANRSFVYPVRRALLASTISGTGHTDAVEEWTITARLLPEDESLTPNRVTAFTPVIKYRDVEVFNGALWQANDWSEQREYEVDRRTVETDFDTSLIETESDTIAATETFTYRMTLSGHESISSFLGWYYERVGALTPVWAPTMQEDFEILGVNAPNVQITVRDTNYSDAYALAEPRRDIVFVYRDGSMVFRRVTAFEGTVNETLTLDATIPSLVNLRFVSLLKYVRLDADQLELAWQTDEVIQVAWRFRELLTTPEGTGRSSLSPSASLSASVSPSSSASPSASVSPSLSPSLSPSPSASVSPSGSVSPSASISPSGSQSPSASPSPTPSASESASPSASTSPSGSESPSPSPSASASPSV